MGAEAKGFDKFARSGPYHWAAISRSIRDRHLFTMARYEGLLRVIRGEPALRICDYGCGDGALTFLLSQDFPNAELIGIEPDPVGRELAKDILKARGVSCQVLESADQLPASHFDVIICADVIEHVSEAETFLCELKRLLKPGGKLALSTPVRVTEAVWDSEHKKEFFPGELAALVGQFFDVKKHDFVSSAFTTGLYSIKPRMFGSRPVLRYMMNVFNILTGINLLLDYNPEERLWLTQVIRAEKR
jgi:2-polyprenyl-3-methyl-5-hydroxy-6-metoxy-1,4-benzoquinol methylase